MKMTSSLSIFWKKVIVFWTTGYYDYYAKKIRKKSSLLKICTTTAFIRSTTKSSHFLYIFVDKIWFVCMLWFWFQRLGLSFFVYRDLSKCNFTKRRKLNFYDIKSNILNLFSILTIIAHCSGMLIQSKAHLLMY